MTFKLPKGRTHFKVNELSEYLFTEELFPDLIEYRGYEIKGKRYTYSGLNGYKFIKFLKQSKTQPVNGGVDKFYSKEKVERLYQELKSIDSEKWISGDLPFLK